MILGAVHTDELDNLFRRKLFESWGIPPLQKGTDQHRVMEEMIEMWVNFAKTGFVLLHFLKDNLVSNILI